MEKSKLLKFKANKSCPLLILFFVFSAPLPLLTCFQDLEIDHCKMTYPLPSSLLQLHEYASASPLPFQSLLVCYRHSTHFHRSFEYSSVEPVLETFCTKSARWKKAFITEPRPCHWQVQPVFF